MSPLESLLCMQSELPPKSWAIGKLFLMYHASTCIINASRHYTSVDFPAGVYDMMCTRKKSIPIANIFVAPFKAWFI